MALRRLRELPQFWNRPQTSPLNTEQMQEVIKRMTNEEAEPQTIEAQFFALVIPGKVVDRQHNQGVRPSIQHHPNCRHHYRVPPSEPDQLRANQLLNTHTLE